MKIEFKKPELTQDEMEHARDAIINPLQVIRGAVYKIRIKGLSEEKEELKLIDEQVSIIVKYLETLKKAE